MRSKSSLGLSVDIDYTPETAEVRQQKKLHYTVTPIGEGPEALAAWKLQRQAIEAEYEKKRAPIREARREHVMSIVAMDNKPKALTDNEKAEQEYLLKTEADAVLSSKRRKKYVQLTDEEYQKLREHYHNYKQVTISDVTEALERHYGTITSVSKWQSFKSWVADFVSDALFSK